MNVSQKSELKRDPTFVIQVVIASMLIVAFIIAITTTIIKDYEDDAKIETLAKTSRFKTVGYEMMGRKEVRIIEDTKTGIKYMSVWGGMANGGPAMCRLWEKKTKQVARDQ